MGVNEEFKKALKAGNLALALKLAMACRVELKITTTLVSADASKQSLSTRINLLEGAIDNVVSEEFIDKGTYEAIKQFHFAQVSDVNQTMGNNLDSLSKMFRLMAKVKQQHSSQPQVAGEDETTLEAEVTSPPEVIVTPEVVVEYFDTPETPEIPETKTPPQTIKPEVETFVSYTSSQLEVETIVPEVITPTVDIDDFDLGDDIPSDNDDEWGDFLDEIDDDQADKNSNHKKDSDDDF